MVDKNKERFYVGVLTVSVGRAYQCSGVRSILLELGILEGHEAARSTDGERPGSVGDRVHDADVVDIEGPIDPFLLADDELVSVRVSVNRRSQRCWDRTKKSLILLY